MKKSAVVMLAVSVSVLGMAGCHVTDHGKKGNVDISTPFGAMQVKTDNNNDAEMTGLSLYPGSTPVKDKGSDHDSADVNFSFGKFHLGVKAASYQTADSPDKVLAFYRKDMARYGDVIQCRDDKAVGTPVKTTQGLTCEEQHRNVIHTDDLDHDQETDLRAGSPHMQHIVGVQSKDGGTRIGLVYLNLPHGDKDSKDAE